MVLPPNPPVVRNGGRPRCEHDKVKFKKISKSAVGGFCARCDETLGIIIVDPNPQRINAYMSVHVQREDVVIAEKPEDVMITGKPRRLSYSERLKLK